MKKALIITAITLLTLIGLAIAAVYTVMQTQYAARFVSTALSKVTPYSVTVSSATYTPPLQLSLTDVSLELQDQHLKIPKLDLWLNHNVLQQGKLAFDSILIEQVNLDWRDIQPSWFEHIFTYQLALKHADIDGPNWSARGVNIQVDNPSWVEKHQHLPYGDIQLAMSQLYVRGEALDNLLIDLRYQPQKSTIFGSSFTWRGAEISGQAEQYAQGWSLVNVTVDGLNLPTSKPANQILSTLEQLEMPIYHLNSLDILNSSFRYAGWDFNNLDASLEQLTLDNSLWQQEEGYFSFNAERVASGEFTLISPRAKVTLTHHQIEVEEFDSDFQQGRVQFSGELTPQQVALKQLKVSGIKWLEETYNLAPSLAKLASPLKQLSIERLDIKNVQFIQVEKTPYWQLSGLNIDGHELTLIQNGQFGLFHGKIEASVNSANLDKIIASQAHLQASASHGHLILERAFVPLEQGYIEASGTWDARTVSAPWQFSMHADGLPLAFSMLQQQLPFELTGLMELDIEMEGLAGDYAMLAHSLSGRIVANIRGAQLRANSANGEQSFQQAWPLEEIELLADRGRIAIHSVASNSELAGQIDLTKTEFATLILRSDHQCQQLWSDILDRANVIKLRCVEQTSTADLPYSEPQSLADTFESSTDL